MIYASLQVLDGWAKLLIIVVAAQWVALSARDMLIAYLANSFLVATGCAHHARLRGWHDRATDNRYV